MAKIIHISLLTQLEIDIVFLTLFFVHIRLFLIFGIAGSLLPARKGPPPSPVLKGPLLRQ